MRNKYGHLQNGAQAANLCRVEFATSCVICDKLYNIAIYWQAD